MPSVEVKAKPPIETVTIARAVLVAPITLPEFKRRFVAAGGWTEQLSLTNVFLLQKSAASKPSAGLVMATGGTADSSETRSAASMREVAEEIHSFALHEQSTRQDWAQTAQKVIEFGIGTDAYPQTRALSIGVLPVSSFAWNKPRERDSGPESEDKIARVPTFTPSEFRTLVTDGSVRREDETLRAAGHFTLASVDYDPIDMTSDQRAIQREVLTGVVQEVEQFDHRLKKYTKGAINKIRLMKGLPSVEDLAQCSIDEISTGFIAAQMKLALTDQRAEEIPDATNKKTSLLRILPYLTSELPPATIADLLLYLPTHETIYATHKLAQGFKDGVKTLVNNVGILLPNKQDLLERLSQDGVEHDIDSVAVLQEVWPAVIGLADTERIPLLIEANKATVRGLADAYGVKKGVVKDAERAANGFHDFMKNDLRGNENATHKYFQDFRPMNEITNAGLFIMMVLALGYHPNRPYVPDQTMTPDIEARILRFEALRQLALISVGIEVTGQLRKADSSLFEAALDTFFDNPKKEVIEVGEGQLLNVYDRETVEEVNGRRLHVRIDEGLKKRTVSGIRKRFQSNELKDLMPISIIVTDENFADRNVSVEERIQTAEALREQFITHARERVGEGYTGWTITIDDHRTQSIEHVQELAERRRLLLASGIPVSAVDGVLQPYIEPSGKGPGSKGDAIIRDKFFMVYSGPNDEKQTIEVNIYPFESTNTPEVDWLSKLGKWGHKEWSIDNAQGNYLANRLTERSAKAPMTQTFAEDLYLSVLYAALMDKTGQLVTRKDKLRRQREKS